MNWIHFYNIKILVLSSLVCQAQVPDQEDSGWQRGGDSSAG